MSNKVNARDVRVSTNPETGEKAYFYTGEGCLYVELAGGEKVYLTKVKEENIEKFSVADVAYDRKGNLLYVGEGAKYEKRPNGSRRYKDIIDISLVDLADDEEIRVLDPLFEASEIGVNINPNTGDATFFHVGEDAPYMMFGEKKVYCGIVDEREISKYPVESIAFDENGSWVYVGNLPVGSELSELDEMLPISDALIDFENAQPAKQLVRK